LDASLASRAVARRLFLESAGSATDDAALVQAAERTCACVSDGLARWFGPYGSLALVSRALGIAQARHPSLASVNVSSTPSPRFTGFAASAQSHGASAMVDGVVTLLAALDELLGRLIGDDLTRMLLEQCAASSAADARGERATNEDLPHTMSEQ
jgi:hypothetical protein